MAKRADPIKNSMKCVFPAKSINESFARMAVSAFVSQLDPPVSVLAELKTAVSEAVTNAIVHGYKEKQGKIYITVSLFENNNVRIRIRDKGVGIEDVTRAMEPLYTTAGDERAGLGFAVMESFMDRVRVTSRPQKGTTVTLEKRIWGKNI